MSTLCPHSITKGDDGLSVKVEWDVHYLTDEQIGMVRKYIAETEAENAELRKERDALDHLTDVLNATNDGLLAENAKLRELVRRMFYAVHPADREKFLTNVAELGVEV